MNAYESNLVHFILFKRKNIQTKSKKSVVCEPCACAVLCVKVRGKGVHLFAVKLVSPDLGFVRLFVVLEAGSFLGFHFLRLCSNINPEIYSSRGFC